MKVFGKSGEVGIGALIIFISMLMVAAIAAGVLMQSSSSLATRTEITADRSKGEVSTAITPLELIGFGEGDRVINHFEFQAQLAPGSEPIEFADSIIVLETGAFSNTLSYRGQGSKCIKDNEIGYNTFGEEEIGELELSDLSAFSGNWAIVHGVEFALQVDLDNDGVDDTMTICDPTAGDPCPAPYNGTHFRFTLSQDGIRYVRAVNDDGTQAYFMTGSAGAFNFSKLDIGNYGFISGVRNESVGADGRIDYNDGNLNFKVYSNPYMLDDDLDNDGFDDTVAVNRSHVFVFLSSVGYLNPLLYPLDASLGGAGNVQDMSEQIDYDGVNYGSFVLSGTNSVADVIEESTTFTFTPLNESRGYFTVEYEEETRVFREGVLQDGDVVRICFESSADIPETKTGQLYFIPKAGKAKSIAFETPNVINDELVPLFP